MKKFRKEINTKIMSEEISLPESLSAESIEKLINEKGGILAPARRKERSAVTYIRWCASVAAVIVLAIGVGAVIEHTGNDVKIEQQKENHEQIIEDNLSSSDYSELEKSVLTYFKDIYSSNVIYGADDDGMNFGLESILENFGTKDQASVSSSNSGISNPGSAPNNSVSADNAGNVNLEYTSDSVYSTTNTQVEGVDEADLIKTDGRYIYYIRSGRDEIVITDCEEPDSIKILSRISFASEKLDIEPVEMFLSGDNLVVILRETADYETENTIVDISGAACDCCCIALKFDTVIKIYNIADRSAPEEILSHKITGEYISSRIADGRLITVSRFDIPYSSIRAEDFDSACKVVKDICVPEYSVNGGEMKRIPSERIKLVDIEKPATYTVTSIISLDDVNAEPAMNAFLGAGSEIYCTAEEIFIAENLFSYWSQNEEKTVEDALGKKYTTATRIHKMNITDEGVEYIADVTVGGLSINQFSMDKHGDYFRIATNGSEYRGGFSGTMVYVIDKDMNIVGFLGGIAEGEDMKSARFMGDVLYLVTFMQTDPLFVIDLSDPEKPEIKGELKIPGFSTYLHPIGNGLVLGMGAGGTMNGTDGTAKISLFDVSDPCNPKELDNYTTNYSAEFISSHRAFVQIDNNTYAMPVSSGYTKDNLIVFSVENNSIIIDGNYSYYYGNSTYQAARCAFINDSLFTVNPTGIIAYSLTTEEEIGRIKF